MAAAGMVAMAAPTAAKAAPTAAKAAADAAVEGSTLTQTLDFHNFWWQKR
jgi:hypothetical protein